jgi:hypothetical protein
MKADEASAAIAAGADAIAAALQGPGPAEAPRSSASSSPNPSAPASGRSGASEPSLARVGKEGGGDAVARASRASAKSTARGGKDGNGGGNGGASARRKKSLTGEMAAARAESNSAADPVSAERPVAEVEVDVEETDGETRSLHDASLAVEQPDDANVPTGEVAPEVVRAASRIDEIDADLSKFAKERPEFAPDVDEEYVSGPSPLGGEIESGERFESVDEPISSVRSSEYSILDDVPTGEKQKATTDEASIPSGVTASAEGELKSGTQVVKQTDMVLLVQPDGTEGVEVNVDRFLIGRGPHCNLVIDSPRVSREHVAVTRRGAGYYIEDLGSSNGTWFLGARITRREIENGDIFTLGNEAVLMMLQGK